MPQLFILSGAILALFILFIVLLPLIALISVLTNEFRGNDKIIYVLLIIFLPFLGSLIYFLVGYPNRVSR